MIKRKILSSVSSQLMYILVSTIIGLAIVPLTIGMLGKIEYGAFELILSLIMIDAVLEFGLGSALVKYIPEYKENKCKLKSFAWSYFYLKNVLTLLGFIIVIIVGKYFDTLFNIQEINNLENIKYATFLFGLGLFLSGTSTFLDNLLKGLMHFGSSNSLRSIAMIIFFIMMYCYYIFNNKYNIVQIALIWFILKPLILILMQVVLFNYLKLSYIFSYEKFKFKSLKNSLDFMFGMSYITIVAQLYNNLPKIILGVFTNPINVAYWGIMEKIKGPLLQIENSMIRPLIPILSEKQNVLFMTEEKAFQSVRLQYFFISFLGIMTIVHIDLFIFVWLGDNFRTVSTIVELIMVLFIFPKAGVLLMMYYAKGETRINRLFVTIRTILSLILATLILILTKDLILYVSTIVLVSLVMAIYNISKYLSYFNFSKFKFLKDSILSPFIIMLLFYLVHNHFLLKFVSYDIVGLVSSVFISIFIYVGLFFIFMKSEDKNILLKLLRKNR